MLKIKVKYKIWEVVQHVFNKNKYMVIGYNYVESNWVKYVCMQDSKEDYVYMSEIELSKGKESVLWFNIK